VQVGVLIHVLECLLHRVSHAHFVDVAHVEHLEARLVYQALFSGVHAADADLAHLTGFDRGGVTAYARQPGRSEAAQQGHRHAVHVAAGREVGGVEIGMRIEPEHTQLLAPGATVAGHGADGAQAQAVVATEHDRQAAVLQLGEDRFVKHLVPGHHFVEMTVAFVGRLPRVGRPGKIALVDHPQALAFQHRGQVGNPQGFRAHGGATRASADVRGNADEADVLMHGDIVVEPDRRECGAGVRQTCYCPRCQTVSVVTSVPVT